MPHSILPRPAKTFASASSLGFSHCGTAAWLAAGLLFHWSDAWQLVMNTASSIVTFLMVF